MQAYICKNWFSRQEKINAIIWQTIDTPKLLNTNPLYLKYPFQGGCHAVLINADTEYFSVSLKNGNYDIELSHDEPLKPKHKELIHKLTGCNTIDGILKFLQRANPLLPADSFVNYHWLNILEAIKTSPQTANAVDTDREYSPSDKEPQAAFNQWVKLSEFMDNFCESCNHTKTKSDTMHKYCRDGKLVLPQTKCQYKRGKSNLYKVSDLLIKWKDYQSIINLPDTKNTSEVKKK